ncbi:hypothetical protein BT63DRAFT_421035 [Microthyrium microscopicum]|uniref:Uncharacterized protein n=1 Tax=Microthyrium microscopicum TaxID=703497 RepID=A0A6A6UP21_9PEZI|nr:hypothetical protein BT63DRAFT_421035 [Microthyrium microscopicum]
MFRAYSKLPTNQKLILGGAFLIWGGLGLQVLPRMEKKLDLEPDAKETGRMTKVLPRIEVLEPLPKK